MKRATTSASNIYRRALCPGSARMEAQFGSGEESEWSREGTLLHSLFMRPDCTQEERSNLNDDQSDALLSAEAMAAEFIRNMSNHFGIHEEWPVQMLHEVELLFHAQDSSPLFPGHADLIVNFTHGKLRIIVDAKMGFMDVEDAAENYQLCTYAVMAQQRDPVDVCAVAIVQPRNFGPKQSVAVYNAETLDAAAVEIERIFLESEKPDAPLNASPTACHFCSAKTSCEAYKAVFMAIEPVKTEAISTADNEDLERLKLAIQFAGKIEKDVNEELRRRIEEGRMPGWKLKNTGSTRVVNDPIGMFIAFTETFSERLSAVEYEETRETKWGALEKLVQRLSGKTEKDAKAFVKEIANPYVTEVEKAKAPVREKVK